MSPPSDISHLVIAQQNRLRQFNASESVDVHCHCLPGLDDGPPSMAEALKLCQAFVEDGLTTVIATPHQLGKYEGRNWAPQIRDAVEQLRQELCRQNIPLAVHAGADVRVDVQLLDLIASDHIMTLADGGRYILLELPHEAFVDLSQLIQSLSERGIRSIITHPERHDGLRRKAGVLPSWVQDGAVVQLTAGSLIGAFGPEAERASWNWLEQGLVQLIATDAHDAVKRPPTMTRAIAAIGSRMPHVIARRLCIENPAAVLRGEDLPRIHARALAGGRR
jgi:protein-tyrosine phosphatase